MLRMTRAIDFSASLRYGLRALSPEENRRRFGRSAERHGHNYRLEVTVVGEPDPLTGMVMDLEELKTILESEVMKRFDHRDLNDDTPYFEAQPPTPENLGRVLYEILAAALPGRLHGIRLRQSEDLWVDVVATR